jgi:ribosomal protein S18 acetylase RimI-like enzyme
MEIRQIEVSDHDAVERFVARVPEGDRTFFKQDFSGAADVVAVWTELRPAPSIALDGDAVVGYVVVIPLQEWSSHVGEVRLIVDPDHRGRGIGRALARYAVLEALSLGLRKLVVEVVADQEATIAMFRSLGFEPEALLKDHVRDQAGGMRDLMVLAHSVDDSYASMAAIGLGDAIGEQ